MENDGGCRRIMEEVTGLEVTPEGIVLSSLFEEPRLIATAAVKKIDFMATVVTLCPQEGLQHG